jgi:hypothetical protein
MPRQPRKNAGEDGEPATRAASTGGDDVGVDEPARRGDGRGGCGEDAGTMMRGGQVKVLSQPGQVPAQDSPVERSCG